MSQREKRGFNRDPAVFAVSEGEDGEVGPGTIAASAGNAPPVWFGPPLLPSVALGVLYPTSFAASLIVNAFFAPLGRTLASGSLLMRPPFADDASGLG